MKLNSVNIIKLSQNISNYLYEGNFEATKQLVELFDKISKKELSTLEDYIKMYDDSFYTYCTWEELVNSEIEQGAYGLTEEECNEALGKSIWRLPCGFYVQCV